VPGALLYLDASALVKLVAVERESEALARFAHEWMGWLTSRLSAVEVTRAVRRAARRRLIERATAVLEVVAFVELDAEVAELAGTLKPSVLRSLDAIHLASALAVGADIGTFVTYDNRLAEAAGAAGLDVRAPS
jgi:predicted nucleic acid-binding protein